MSANYDDPSGKNRGFLLSNGTFTNIDFPGAFSNSSPFGLNAKGEIVGQYDDSNAVIHGFLLSGGNFFTLAFPNSSSTNTIRVNDLGQIVGWYLLSGERHGFLATPIHKP